MPACSAATTPTRPPLREWPSRWAATLSAASSVAASAASPAATSLGGVLGDCRLGGDLLGADLLGDGVPLVSNLVGSLLAGEEGVLAAEGITEVLPNLDILPGLGVISEILGAFSDSGSIVPGLQVLDEFGVLGILGSL